MPHATYERRFMTPLDRFMGNVRLTDGCWIWTGTITCKDAADKYHLPYGRFWMNGKNEAAHRAAWKLFSGPIPEGKIVCHSCDVAYCVNPAHLFLGTHRDNTQDMMAKGRDKACRETRRGPNSNFAKLTPEQALAVLKAEGKQKDIAAQYGITQTAVSLIKRRVNWKHLEAQ